LLRISSATPARKPTVATNSPSRELDKILIFLGITKDKDGKSKIIEWRQFLITLY